MIVPIWILALYHAVAYAGSRFGSTQLWQQYGAKLQQVLSAYQVHASTNSLCTWRSRVQATALARVFRIAMGLSRYSTMSEVCAPIYLAGLVSTNG